MNEENFGLEVDAFISEVERQAEVLASKNDVVVKLLARHILEGPCPLLKIGANPLPTPPIKEALFISLGVRFDTRNIFGITPGRPLTLADARLGLLFVPVHIVNYEKGLEWSSVHAFVVENGAIQRVVSVVKIHGEYRTLASSDLRFSDEEWTDQEVEEILSERRRTAVQEPQFIEQEVLLTKPDGIIFSRYCSWRENDIFDLTRAEPEVSRDFELKLDGGEMSLRAQAALEWFSEKRGEVYQDGIRLPVDIRNLACVGATAGIVNLTAAARFRLNIPRNAVDLTPSFLANWRKATGNLICEGIAGAVANALDSFGFTFDWSLLWTEASSGFRLENRLEWVGLYPPGEKEH